jgi:hypothetical protein
MLTDWSNRPYTYTHTRTCIHSRPHIDKYTCKIFACVWRWGAYYYYGPYYQSYR